MAAFTSINCQLSFKEWTPNPLYIQRTLINGVWDYELILPDDILCPQVGAVGTLRIEFDGQTIEHKAYIQAEASPEDGQKILYIGELK
jgi:hypothetical protein